ncbi:MAG TPA: thioredoxin domain-containing protein [Puia sp.]|jgi:rhodanese-related sulfurtransferase|nr:thioredoxin domain-containing protein [Puia sp.]
MKVTFSHVLFCILILSSHGYSQTNRTLEPPDFQKKVAGTDAQLLDVRTAAEYGNGHIAHSLLADWNNRDQFKERVYYLEKNAPVYVYCLSGGRSAEAAEWMRNNGFASVYELKGGLRAWKIASMPLEAAADVKQISLPAYRAQIGVQGLVLVDFGAGWCPPCRKMQPVIDQLQKDGGTELRIVKIDAGDQINLMKELNIEGIPAFVFYKNGKELWRKQGLVELEEFKKEIYAR